MANVAAATAVVAVSQNTVGNISIYVRPFIADIAFKIEQKVECIKRISPCRQAKRSTLVVRLEFRLFFAPRSPSRFFVCLFNGD